MQRTLYDETHELFRQSFRSFVQKEIVPHVEEWEQAGIVDKTAFKKAGQSGFLGMAVPEEYGGAGVSDFRFNAVMAEEFCRAKLGHRPARF
jgi:long-chain-acyl-CoA dehydrogenase